MGIFKFSGDLVNGMRGNLNEVSIEKLNEKYGSLLMKDETIQIGFKLIRDMVLFTDCRIIRIDKQGATGQKSRIETIYLDSVINVSIETAGFGIDDSEMTIFYISSPYFKVKTGANVEELKFEFPKSFDVRSLYANLSEIAFANHQKINK